MLYCNVKHFYKYYNVKPILAFVFIEYLSLIRKLYEGGWHDVVKFTYAHRSSLYCTRDYTACPLINKYTLWPSYISQINSHLRTDLTTFLFFVRSIWKRKSCGWNPSWSWNGDARKGRKRWAPNCRNNWLGWVPTIENRLWFVFDIAERV